MASVLFAYMRNEDGVRDKAALESRGLSLETSLCSTSLLKLRAVKRPVGDVGA
jgi:hypothetical protein